MGDTITAQEMVKGDIIYRSVFTVALEGILFFLLYITSFHNYFFICYWVTSGILFPSPITLATLSSMDLLAFALPLWKGLTSLDFYSVWWGHWSPFFSSPSSHFYTMRSYACCSVTPSKFFSDIHKLDRKVENWEMSFRWQCCHKYCFLKAQTFRFPLQIIRHKPVCAP